jgi:hypothetical protein
MMSKLLNSVSVRLEVDYINLFHTCHTAQIGHPHSNLHAPQCKTQRINVTLCVVMPSPADAGLNQNDKG